MSFLPFTFLENKEDVLLGNSASPWDLSAFISSQTPTGMPQLFSGHNAQFSTSSGCWDVDSRLCLKCFHWDHCDVIKHFRTVLLVIPHSEEDQCIHGPLGSCGVTSPASPYPLFAVDPQARSSCGDWANIPTCGMCVPPLFNLSGTWHQQHRTVCGILCKIIWKQWQRHCLKALNKSIYIFSLFQVCFPPLEGMNKLICSWIPNVGQVCLKSVLIMWSYSAMQLLVPF